MAAHIMTHSQVNWNSPEIWVDSSPIYLCDLFKIDGVAVGSD